MVQIQNRSAVSDRQAKGRYAAGRDRVDFSTSLISDVEPFGVAL